MKKIYLATPYSHNDPAIRQKRYEEINRVASSLMKQGHIVYSPISSTHQIAVDCELPTDFKYWEASCKAFIEWCDVLVVYESDGWKESIGVQAEIKYACFIGKPMVFIMKGVSEFNMPDYKVNKKKPIDLPTITEDAPMQINKGIYG